jgi:hypothetical protein
MMRIAAGFFTQSLADRNYASARDQIEHHKTRLPVACPCGTLDKCGRLGHIPPRLLTKL